MNDFLKKIKIFFSNLSGRKRDGSVVGVDIGSSSIKAVQLKKSQGKAVLETYGELALGPYFEAEVGRASSLGSENLAVAMKDLFREANITSKRASFSIPISSSMLTLLEIPVAHGGKLDEMIPIEARKYIPVPISEVLLDWWVIPRKDFDDKGKFKEADYGGKVSQTTEVLLVAIHKNALEKYNSVASAAGMAASSMEIEAFSAVRSLIGHDMSAVMIFDIGASSTKIVIVDYGIVRNTHTINRGSQDITFALSKSLNIPFDKAEKTKREIGSVVSDKDGVENIINSSLEYIFFEANRIVIGYQKKYKRAVGKVILIGGGSNLKGLKERSAEYFGAEVVFGDPFAKTEYPAFLDSVLKEAGPSFAVAVGLALKEL